MRKYGECVCVCIFMCMVHVKFILKISLMILIKFCTLPFFKLKKQMECVTYSRNSRLWDTMAQAKFIKNSSQTICNKFNVLSFSGSKCPLSWVTCWKNLISRSLWVRLIWKTFPTFFLNFIFNHFDAREDHWPI